jgi:hypothetical protein
VIGTSRSGNEQFLKLYIINRFASRDIIGSFRIILHQIKTFFK